MFDNILFQKDTCTELKKDILENTLAPSMLIHGAALSGKTTLALELARVLTCRERDELGRWTCSCWSCRQQRELSQNQVLVLGSSDFRTEIKVCRKYFDQARENQLESKHLKILLLVWLRSLHKVLKRYDEALWKDGKTKTDKERKARKVQEEFVELLAKLRPGDIFGQKGTEETKKTMAQSREIIFQDKKLLDKDLDRCQELADILIAAIPQGIPVQQIRQLQQWSYRTSETCKVAILENVDAMNQAASNAMLKLLEEPPHNCYFILTTRRKQGLLPTVLSRLRLFGLRERSETEERKIVQKVFRTSGTETLRELFLTGEQDFSQIQAECALFMQSLLEKRPFFMIKSSFDKLHLEAFLQNLGLALQKECIEQHRKAEGPLAEHNFFWYQRFLQLGRKAIEQHKIYHDPAILLLQNLYLELLHEGSTEN
ncbi:hypothetical protein P0082_04610 [Candidatus Haliotispira prima]|uniref:DNA polymerase III subunit delta n=1 Tax=Candidatus Haliotispira prima TaxID=3034016 RepID=A0ABY8MLU2_9SPIO|nr:hypothetical protein P0082_04610 [Candidatus Haliotispira prima]